MHSVAAPRCASITSTDRYRRQAEGVPPILELQNFNTASATPSATVTLTASQTCPKSPPTSVTLLLIASSDTNSVGAACAVCVVRAAPPNMHAHARVQPETALGAAAVGQTGHPENECARVEERHRDQVSACWVRGPRSAHVSGKGEGHQGQGGALVRCVFCPAPLLLLWVVFHTVSEKDTKDQVEL